MKINKIKNYVLIAFAVLGLLSVTVPYSTAYAEDALPECNTKTASTPNPNANAAICKTNTNAIGGILQNVINTMIFLAGSIAVIMVIVGGIRYITSDGDPGAATKAKNTIIYALVGVVVAIMSYSIVNFVIDRI